MTLFKVSFRLRCGRKIPWKNPEWKTNELTHTHTHTGIRACVQAETALISQVLRHYQRLCSREAR